MTEEYRSFNEQRLRSENEFLKMKLMLEHNAQYGKMGEVPVEVENAFLRNIIEFEKQFRTGKTISVFDKIGQPEHFVPVDDIPEEDMEKAWSELDDFLNSKGINLDACSPNITKRELYRFAIEELFMKTVDDINIPGMIQGFIYDDFYPDYIFENTRQAKTCIEGILEKELFDKDFPVAKTKLKLNNHSGLTLEEFRRKIQLFKDAYEDIHITDVSDSGCTINNSDAVVRGAYVLQAIMGGKKIDISGKWKVQMVLDQKTGCWYTQAVEITGLNL